MRVNFERRVDASEVLKFNVGIKPRYGRGTMKGCTWCSCGCCTGCMILLEENKIIGWLDTECTVCGNKIDYSEADKYV